MTAVAVTHEPDWRAAGAEAVRHLQHLIRAVTVNPPGNEIVAARYLESVLRAAGIETTLLEPAPTRAALVARLRGSGARRPVLLLAHMDVVGVEPEGWSVDPFAGEIRGGYVYGRGAIDDKGMLAANLQTMLLLKRHVLDAGAVLARDVVFVATSDEEAGGDWGIQWLIDHHPELVDAEFAVNEGGRIRVVAGRPLYAAVQTAEKVSHVVRMAAHGSPGHAAVPLADNAVVRLGRALAAVGAHREPVRLTPTTRAFFGDLAAVWPEPGQGAAMADVASGDTGRVERGARALSAVPVLDAVLRTGVSPVVVSGGIRHNVIPAEASATLNIRTLPGERVADVVARLAAAVGDARVSFEIVGAAPVDPPGSTADSAMFAAIRDAARELDPALVVVPYLSTGATDSARLRAAGVQAYGVLPFPLEQGDEERMHGHDERLPLDSLYFGVRLVYGAIRRVAT